MSRTAEGKPFVPPYPICPTDQIGTLPDLSTTPFEFYIDVLNDSTHYYAVFGNADASSDEYTGIYDSDFVETARLAIPANSELAQKLHGIAGLEGIEGTKQESASASATLPSSEHPLAERMRKSFCERVANCHGVTEGGCWALGASAVREVVEEALRTQHD